VDFNFYRYVGNDPVNFLDPSGLIVAMDNHSTIPSVTPTFETPVEFLTMEDIDPNPGLMDVSDIFIPISRILGGIAKGIEGLFKGAGGVKVVGVAKKVPKLRQKYINAVKRMCKQVKNLRKAGLSEEAIARKMSAGRRAIGKNFKTRTPKELRGEIYKRNEGKYTGDALGPTIDSLIKKGKTWTEIIESSCRTGGKDMDFTKK